MATLTIAAKANTSIFNPVFANAVTSVTVSGTPVAFTNTGGSILLAAALATDAAVVLTYDATNPRAGAIEFRLLELNARLAALDAMNIGSRLAALDALNISGRLAALEAA